MSAEHTPGPWKWFGDNLLSGEGYGGDVLKAEDDRKPYGMHSALIEHHFDEATKEANKRLIAAAPDLLDVLQKFINSGRLQSYEDRERFRRAAGAAIAKATGSQP